MRVVHKQTAASSSASPERTGQHWFTTGSPSPMCTNPPSRSTQAPNFSVSMGQVSLVGGVGQGFPLGGLVTGGTVPGGRLIGGTVTGGRSMGGLTIGGTTGGNLIGGFTRGGKVMGPLGDFPLGFRCLCAFPHEPHPRIGVTEEMKSMQIKRRADILVLGVLTRAICHLKVMLCIQVQVKQEQHPRIIQKIVHDRFT